MIYIRSDLLPQPIAAAAFIILSLFLSVFLVFRNFAYCRQQLKRMI